MNLLLENRIKIANEAYEFSGDRYVQGLGDVSETTPGMIIAENGWEDDGQGAITKVIFLYQGPDKPSEAKTFGVQFHDGSWAIESFLGGFLDDFEGAYLNHLDSWKIGMGPMPAPFKLAIDKLEEIEDMIWHAGVSGEDQEGVIKERLVDLELDSTEDFVDAMLRLQYLQQRALEEDKGVDLDRISMVFWMNVMDGVAPEEVQTYIADRFCLRSGLRKFFYPEAVPAQPELAL